MNLNLLNVTNILRVISYNFIYSVISRFAGWQPAGFIKLNSLVEFFQFFFQIFYACFCKTRFTECLKLLVTTSIRKDRTSKQMLLKISKNSQENTSARVSFLKKRLWRSGTVSALYIQGRMPQEKRFIVGRKDIYKGVLEERIPQKDNLINYFCLFF